MTLFFQWASRILAFAALLWCIWTGYQIWTTPVSFQEIEEEGISDGVTITRQVTGTQSFSEISGLGVTPLVIPVLITMVAVWATVIARTGVLMAAALVLLFFWFLSGFSIGGAYTPAVLALFGATISSFVQTWRRRKQTVA